MRFTLVIGMSVLLTSCASHQWAPGPNVAPNVTFEQQKARCSYVARHGGSPFIAAGDPNFVAGAAVGHGIGEAVRANADFNDCMLSTGWVTNDPKQ